MVNFDDIRAMLDAVAKKATNDIGNSPHGSFWNDLDYADFISGKVPNVSVGGVSDDVSIIDPATPLNSHILQILLGKITVVSAGTSRVIRQMPEGGPFITGAAYSVDVGGTMMSGTEIQQAIQSWLANGMPEN